MPRAKRITLRLSMSLNEIPKGSPAQRAFLAALRRDLATALSISLGTEVGIYRFEMVRAI